MTEALIRCGNGCGSMLTFQRLREGRRTKSGVWCERCVAEKHMERYARWLGKEGPERQVFVAEGVNWIMRDSVH